MDRYFETTSHWSFSHYRIHYGFVQINYYHEGFQRWFLGKGGTQD
jgi:hypothetical protein